MKLVLVVGFIVLSWNVLAQDISFGAGYAEKGRTFSLGLEHNRLGAALSTIRGDELSMVSVGPILRLTKRMAVAGSIGWYREDQHIDGNLLNVRGTALEGGIRYTFNPDFMLVGIGIEAGYNQKAGWLGRFIVKF